jgi:hypothetical protein
MVGMLRRQSQRKGPHSPSPSDHGCGEYCGPRFCPSENAKLSAFRGQPMNIFRTDRLRLKLRVMSDEDLSWLFLHRREECSREFWEELENRKSAGTLSEASPFWAMSNVGRHFHTRGAARLHCHCEPRFPMSDGPSIGTPDMGSFPGKP